MLLYVYVDDRIKESIVLVSDVMCMFTTAPTDDTISIQDILNNTMKDFMFQLDRVGANRSNIFQVNS